MKKTTLYFVLVSFMCISMNTLNAQKCRECEIALTKHATDEFESKTSKKFDEASNELFSHDYQFWSSYQKTTNTSANAAFSIFSASFSNGSSESSQKFESMRSNYMKNHSLSQDEQEWISSKIASKTSYDAWTTCIKECNKGGIYLEKEGNNDDEFIISLRYIPRSGLDQATTLSGIVFTNCTFVSGDLRQGNTIAPWNTLLGVFKRTDRNADITISVSILNLSAPEPILIPKYTDSYIPPIIPPTPSVPVGTVVAFTGNKIPSGWLLCDGSIVNESSYQALSYAIGTLWGTGDHSKGSFNLPDMRGMFLRGVDGEAGNDPDKSTRTATNGGSSGNAVGSKEDDSFKSHGHGVKSSTINSPSGGTPFEIANASGIRYSVPTDSAGGSETRPKNVYVFYIIKY